MKIKSLSDLGGLYSNIVESNITIPDVATEKANQAVVHTDTSVYLTENMVKAGSALGGNAEGGAGVKKVNGVEVTPPLKNSGPAGLQPKKSGFKPVDKMEDPGSDKKKMKEEEEGKEVNEVKDGEADTESVKNTTPKEKVKETVAENNKYIYKPKFTMSKSKFDQLYLEALKGVPFNENEEAMHMHDEEEAGVMPATDAAADGEHEMGGEHEEESHLSHEEAIEAVEKLLKFLKKDMEADKEQGTLDHEDEEQGAEEEEEGMMAEEVEVEDEGHVLTKVNGSLKKGNPDAVNKPVIASTKGTNKATGGKAEDGKIRNEPEPKEVEGDESAMHGNKNKLQNIKKFTAGATKEPKVGDDLFA